MLEARVSRVAKLVLFGLEAITVVALTALIVLALLGLVMELPGLVHPPFLGAERLGPVLEDVLAVFILLELLATAIAYIKGAGMVRRIMEAMLVALARKLISLELSQASIEKIVGLALLIAAVGAAWALIAPKVEGPPGASLAN